MLTLLLYQVWLVTDLKAVKADQQPQDGSNVKADRLMNYMFRNV